MSSALDLTLVVPAHDKPKTIKELLDAVSSQLPAGTSMKAVVCDDVSEPPLAEALLSERFAGIELKVVRRDSNGGPGAARNSAMTAVDSSWVVFLDADERPGDGWIERLQGLIQTTSPADLYEGAVTPPNDAVVTPFVHTIDSNPLEDQHVGGNVLMRSKVLRSIGGFSEDFFDPKAKLHFREDADFWFRLQDAGISTEYDPHLRAFHPLAEPRLFLPTKLSRRYYFDPLLSKRHPERFRQTISARKVGPISLRQARHVAAVAHCLALLALVVALVGGGRANGKRALRAIVATTALNSMALGWGKKTPGLWKAALFLNGFTAPVVYVSKFMQGVVRFRHWPKL